MEMQDRYRINTQKLSAVLKSIILLLITIGVFSACPFTEVPPYTGLESITGAMIVQYGRFLYAIGGTDSAGNILAEIHRSTITLVDGKPELSPWELSDLPLPEGRASAAAMAIGDYLYVIGGMGPDGPTDTIFITKINSTDDAADGSLGFGESTKYWVDHRIPLPEPRAEMAWAYHDGRIFLIGGKGTEGNFSTIIHARIFPSLSKTGHWYTSPRTLPSPRSGLAAAVLSDRLYVAGGWDIHGVSDEVLSYTLGPYGILTNPVTGTPLPEPLVFPILIPDYQVGGSTLIAAGGLLNTGHYSNTCYQYHDNAWTTRIETLPVEGPSYGTVAGHLIALPHQNETTGEQSIIMKNLALAPVRPLLSPGSGVVRTRTKISMASAPGTSIHYIINPGSGDTPDADDSLWDTSAPISITENTVLLFRSIRETDTSLSPVVRREYRVRAGSFILDISGKLYPQPSSTTELLPLAMEVPLSPPNPPMQVSSAWYKIPINSTKQVSISWADADDSDSYTARASLTLFEEDFYTEVLDIQGYPVSSNSLSPAVAQQLPRRVISSDMVILSSHPSLDPAVPDPGLPGMIQLAPGTYYLFIEDLDALVGGTVGFLMKEAP